MTDVRPALQDLIYQFLMVLDCSYSPNDILEAADNALDEYETSNQQQWQPKSK